MAAYTEVTTAPHNDRGRIGTLLGIFACGVLFFVMAMPGLVWLAGVASGAGR